MKHFLIIISFLLLSCDKNSTSPDLCLNQDSDNDGICDSEDDCIGEYDECGVCNGDSIADGGCDSDDDCASGIYDCAGVCDGNTVEDCTGVCGGDAVLSGCDNICNSTAVEDCLGVCNGTSIWCEDDDGYLDNLHDFQFNGSITSQILIENISIVDQGDILAAFVDDDLRGVAIPTEVPFGPHAGTYQFLLLVYSNTAAGETIDFQFYDSDLDIVYNIVRTVNNIIQTTNFTTDMILGDVISPEIFNIVN